MSGRKTIRLSMLVLAIVLCLSIIAPSAAARGSLYISTYNAYMTAGNSGNVTAWFDITGTGTMDQIGAVTVYVYEDGTLVKTFSHTTTAGMMASNTFFHASSVTYSGTVGKNYSACVVFQAGKNGSWDNRSMSTNSVKAKN